MYVNVSTFSKIILLTIVAKKNGSLRFYYHQLQHGKQVLVF
jgi:hypothetical protein